MPIKQCSKCGKWKETIDFYRDTHKDPRKRTKDGFDSRCKVCMSAYARERYKLEPVRAAHRQSAKKRYYSPKGRAYIETYLHTDNGRERCNRYRRSEKGQMMRQRGKDKHINRNRAEHKVAYAIECGQLPSASSLPCSICGKQAREYHHHKGYAKEH